MKVSARVKLTVEISIDGAWDNKCPVEQIHKQVGDEAIMKLNKALYNTDISISGKPSMDMVFMKDEP